jgi:uncharacterized protein with GYD domain
VYITIQLQKDAARALQGVRAAETEEVKQVKKAARELGVELKPMNPGVTDPDMASYFFVEVPDAATAERVISRLSSCSAIEAAYLKPADELP